MEFMTNQCYTSTRRKKGVSDMNSRIDFKKLGHTLKEVREMENITQSEVASYLGVDQSMISKLEKGERAISAEALNNLAKLFCFPVKELLDPNAVLSKGKVAFRTDNLTFEDNCVLANVNAIILNQLEMDEVTHGKNR